WQDVRKALEEAHLNYMNGLKSPEDIVKVLDQKADAALAKAAGAAKAGGPAPAK
ncbi:MAG: hypothetical protein HZB16_06820, partial [Armatimonadetes bacterium]|nr:hypothetical protein [Armatimonadota bacterium]